MNLSILLILLVCCFVASLLGTSVMRRYLLRHHIIDRPNARSSHKTPTPRGAGLVTALIVFACYGIFSLLIPGHAVTYWPLMLGLLAVTTISWFDDISSLAPRWRLLVQLTAVVLVLAFSKPNGLVFQGFLPAWADTVVAGLAWLWFINLYNFMDGLDGITGMQTVFIAAGVSILGFMNIGLQDDHYYALVLIAAMLGFLKHNWHPASIFMGDVGSISLGFILGWMLLNLAATGHIAAALILPAYYVTDTSVTLLRRLFAGKKVWESHAEHFYQKALKIGGLSHVTIVRKITVANVALLLLSLTAALLPGLTIEATCVAVPVVLFLLYDLAPKKKR